MNKWLLLGSGEEQQEVDAEKRDGCSSRPVETLHLPLLAGMTTATAKSIPDPPAAECPVGSLPPPAAHPHPDSCLFLFPASLFLSPPSLSIRNNAGEGEGDEQKRLFQEEINVSRVRGQRQPLFGIEIFFEVMDESWINSAIAADSGGVSQTDVFCKLTIFSSLIFNSALCERGCTVTLSA